MTKSAPKSTTLIMLEEQLKWAYEGSAALNGRIDWANVLLIEKQIKDSEEGR